MNVGEWRKAERERLLAWRQGLSEPYRSTQTAAICAELDRLIPADSNAIMGAYWPIRAEPDLREWLKRRALQGLRIALPVALEHGRPLAYRLWQPGARMARGLWQIPYPADGWECQPGIVLAPVVGFDADGYRLGYGGGFFDRTLAAASPRPEAIGLGYPGAAIDTIFPQAHDIPMDRIVTGAPAV
jgi:5,10-methenyltetrahydrofolate synthetase